MSVSPGSVRSNYESFSQGSVRSYESLLDEELDYFTSDTEKWESSKPSKASRAAPFKVLGMGNVVGKNRKDHRQLPITSTSSTTSTQDTSEDDITASTENNEENDWYEDHPSYSSPAETVSKLQEESVKGIALYVDEYDKGTFHRLLETLLQNRSLTSIKVSRLDGTKKKRVRSKAQMKQLFAALKALPKLQKLELCNMERPERKLIKSIIDQHPTLTTVRLSFARGARIHHTILTALANAAKISDVSLGGMHKSFPLEILLKSKTLKHLRVDSDQFRFKDNHFVAAMQLLEHNDTLETLDLRPKLSILGMRALAFSVDENKRLKTLKFSFTAPTKNAGKMLLHLVHALTRNTTLEAVQNYSAHAVPVSEADEVRMMDLLESNATIESFEVFDDCDCQSDMDRLLLANKADKRRKPSVLGSFSWWNYYVYDSCKMLEFTDDFIGCTDDFHLLE